MATLNSSSTAVELEDLRRGSLENAAAFGSTGVASSLPTAAVPTFRQTRAGLADGPQAGRHDAAVDPALEASRIADSTVPDGGYGWIVITACAVMSWWNIGLSYTWGVYQGALLERGVGTALALSFCGSLSPALMASLGMLNARAMRSLGIRKLALAGMTLNALSQLGASFVTDHIVGLFFLPGVLSGIGMSACFMAFSVAPAQYFRKKRGLANGIVYAGGGLGGAVMSIAINAIIESHGVAWGFRVSGLVLAATGLPAAWYVKERTPIQASGFVDWTLFRQPNFAILFLASAIGVFPLFVPPYFIPLYSRSMGLSTGAGAGLLAGFNFSSAVGRIMSGYLCDVFGSLNTLVAFLIVNSLTMLALWPASTSIAPLAAFAVLNGLTNGGFFSSMPTVVGNVFGSSRVSTAMAMVIVGWVAGYLFGSPIAGYLLEAYGGADGGLQAYRPAMFYAGSVSLASTILVGVMRLRMSTKLWAKV